jgi:predicted nucleic acid-binding protein
MDSDVTIALLKSDTIDVLGKLTDFRFMITEVNEYEISREPGRSQLKAAIARGNLVVTPLTDPAGLVIFADLLRVVDEGEAAAIALATVTSGDIAMHDSAGRRAAATYIPRECIHRLDDIIVEAIRRGCLTVEEADGATAKLRMADDYQPAFAAEGFRRVVADAAYGISRDRSQVRSVSQRR